MNDVFRPYLRIFVLVLFDDILAYSSSWKALETMLLVLQKKSLYVKYSKCLFVVHKIDYLGHTFFVGGVHTEKENPKRKS